jgi:hypothetical protein
MGGEVRKMGEEGKKKKDMDRRGYFVHSPDAKVNVPYQPWAGLPADRSVRDLLLYLDCRLSENYWMARTTFCESALRELGTQRFRMERTNLNAADRDLFAGVREALVGGGPGAPERTLSHHDVLRLYRRVLPDGVFHLPFVIRVGDINHSWFVPNFDGSEFTSALSVDDGLRLAVLTDRAMRPVGLVPAAPPPPSVPVPGALYAWGDGGELLDADADADADDGPTYRWLEDTRRLVGFVQGIRRDSESQGLRVEDRRVLFKVILNTLQQKVPAPAVAVASPAAAEARAPSSSSDAFSVATSAEDAVVFPPPPIAAGRLKRRYDSA